jgi:hypothetical protein
MPKATTTQRWFTGWRTSARSARDDPADYGTAFGLDLSLCADIDLPPAPPPGGRRPGWMQRLAHRRKPAA